MVPRMMRGLPVLVMRGILRMVVVVNGRSGVVCMPVNGLGSRSWEGIEWEKSRLSMYARLYKLWRWS